MRSTVKAIGAITAGVIAVGLVGVGGAAAGSLITSDDIKNDTIKSIDINDGTVKVKDLTDNAISTLQNKPADGATGAIGATGPAGPVGPQGPKGDQGTPGVNAPAAQYGLATVNVKRGAENAVAWATYSTLLGSPVGDMASGTFRFSCSDAQAPCLVSVKAAALSPTEGTVKVLPRVLITRQDFNGAALSYCEYGDGSVTDSGLATITKQASSAVPTFALMPIHIGASADCGGPDTTAGGVDSINVPSGRYNVHSTFTFTL